MDSDTTAGTLASFLASLVDRNGSMCHFYLEPIPELPNL